MVQEVQEVQEVQNEMLEELVSKRKVAVTSSHTCESQLLGMTMSSQAGKRQGELSNRLWGLVCLGFLGFLGSCVQEGALLSLA